MRFRATFQSGADRSGGALRAESDGLECAIDAARRLRVRPWTRLEAAAEESDFDPTEWHHVKVTRVSEILGGGKMRVRMVESLPFYKPSEWDQIAKVGFAAQAERELDTLNTESLGE